MQRLLPIVALVFANGAFGQTVVSLRSGLLNYSQGRIQTTDSTVKSPHVGIFHLRAGHNLLTNNGRVELLLAPAVFLRLAENSEVSMDNDSVGEVRVSLIKGTAIVEVVDLVKNSKIEVGVGSSVAALRHPGIYRFDAEAGEVLVYDGKMDVTRASSVVQLKKGKRLALNADTKPQDYDRKEVDRLQRWSARRAIALAQSNLVSARTSYGNSWRRFARPWVWSLLTNTPAARSAPQPVPSGY